MRILIMLIFLSSLFSQKLWVNGGLGFAPGLSSPTIHGLLSISGEYNDYVLSFRFDAADGGSTGMFDPANETIYVRTLLFGKRKPIDDKSSHIYTIGLSKIEAEERYNFHTTGWFGSSYDSRMYTLYGISLGYQYLIYLKYIGIGIDTYLNLNRKISHAGLVASLYLGELK